MKTKRKKDLIYYPLLLALYPILFFYSQNQSQLSLDIIFLPLVLSIISTTILWTITSLIYKNVTKGALFTFTIVAIFFSYGHISNLLKNLFIPVRHTIIGPNKVLFPLIIIILSLITIYLFKTKKINPRINTFLNILLAFLVIFQTFNITTKEKQIQKQTTSQSSNQTNLNSPDVYYIILDSYANQSTLKNLYNHDNSTFIKQLQDLGFVVVDNASSNYTQTYLSLPSSLNMEHVTYFSERIGTSSSDTNLPFSMIHQNKVIDEFRVRGYEIINFSSGWGPTDQLKGADINFSNPSNFTFLGKNISLNEFYIVFLQTTATSPFIKQHLTDIARDKVLYNFDQLTQIPYRRGQHFVLCHFNIPHPPYLFDENGNSIPEAALELAGDSFSDKEHYLQQLIFTNKKTIKTLKEIINNSRISPIIILQSDHGPASTLGHPFDWTRPAPINGIKERMLILNAYFLPEHSDVIYPEITPVNSFRLIFNTYFQTNYSLLPDTNYFSDYNNMYEFFDVTTKIREPWQTK